MHSLENLPEDDRLTVIAISAVAYIFQDVCHEGGHAVVGWLSGAHRITVSTVAFQIDIDSRWAVAAGVLVNLISAALLLLLLLKPQRYKAATHYFPRTGDVNEPAEWHGIFDLLRHVRIR